MTQEKRVRLALGAQLVLALLLGLAVGLFCGERAAFFKDIGNAFILLLQMPMLPYITLTPITPHISVYLRERLPNQRRVSPHTCMSYAHSFQSGRLFSV
jgi:ABC-type polysaccharide/polyol phosphate export permease